MNYLIVIILVSLSGLFSGLTLGFFSLNKDDLRRKAKVGNKKAIKIYKIRQRGNLLLCTLLIGNVAVNTALSIFLGSLVSGFIAGLTATALIVIFGEIVPQATFSRYAMFLGAKMVWVVEFFIIILFPVCFPLAWLLDKILGKEAPNFYSKKELITLVEEHEDSSHSDIDADEKKIVKGALSYSNKKVGEVMTPRSVMYALAAEQKLTRKVLKVIKHSGLSRIPVYQDSLDQIIGILFVKDLIGVDLKDKTVAHMAKRQVFFVAEEETLDDLFNAFRRSKNHLFIVHNDQGLVSGVITIEDILEEIIGAEIIDEFDIYKDFQQLALKIKNQIR